MVTGNLLAERIANKRKLSVTIFESTRDLAPPEVKAESWNDITAYLADRPPTAAHKEHLKLFKLCRFGETPNPGGKGSYRWNGNVLHVSGILAEHDAGTVTVEEAAQRLEAAGLAAFIYTTPSHMRDGKGPRWRVMSPLSVDMPPDQHAALVDKLNGVLGGCLAPESWVLTQPMYYGKVDSADVVYVTKRIKGRALDLVDGITPITKKGEAKLEPVAAEPVAASTTTNDAPQDLQWIRDILATQDPDMSEPEWWKMGARISYHTGHSEDGYQLFDSWSAGSLSDHEATKYAGPEATRKKWDEIGSRADQANPATFNGMRQASDFGPTPAQESLDLTRTVIELIPLDDFIVSTPTRELVEGLIESAQLFAFIGKRKGGKSYAALELTFCVAQGRDFAGHKVLEPGPVVWIAAEGARSLKERRGPQWRAHYGKADIRVWPKPLNMRKQETYDGLLEACKGAKLIVIDSLRRVTPGAKENSSDELGEVLAYAEHLALATGAAVCIIAHASNKSSAEGADMTARGSSVIEDQVEAGFMVEKVGDGDAAYFRLTPGFARDEETGDALALHFKLEPIAPPGLKPGAIVRWIAEPPKKGKSSDKTWDQLTHDQRVLRVVDESMGQLCSREYIQRECRARYPEGTAPASLEDRVNTSLRGLVKDKTLVALQLSEGDPVPRDALRAPDEGVHVDRSALFKRGPVRGNPDSVAQQLAAIPPSTDPNNEEL